MTGLGIGLVSALTAAAVFVSYGDPLLSILPVAAAAAAWALWTLPESYAVAIFLYLTAVASSTTEVAIETQGTAWTNPAAPLSRLMYTNLPHLGANPIDLCIVLLMALGVARRVRRAHAGSGAPGLQVPRSLLGLEILALMSVLAFEAWGLVRGGNFRGSLWQVRDLLYIPMTALAVQLALPGPRDHEVIGKAIVAAALTKAAIIAHAQLFAFGPAGFSPPFVTSHGDSLLFVLASIIVLVNWIERRTLGSRLLLVGSAALLGLAIQVNGRRLAWAELDTALLLLYFVTPWTPRKRSLTRIMLGLIPVFALYVAAGWGSSAAMFGPVRIVRSLMDQNVDASTESRSRENYNLVFTFKQSPLLGSGFGHEYIELVQADDLTFSFEFWRLIPHNSLLGLFAFTGIVGFSLFWLPLVAGIFYGVRSVHRAREPAQRVAAVAVTVAFACHAQQAFGDMALQDAECALLVGVSLAVAGRLAVAVKAWPAPAGHEAAEAVALRPLGAGDPGPVTS